MNKYNDKLRRTKEGPSFPAKTVLLGVLVLAQIAFMTLLFLVFWQLMVYVLLFSLIVAFILIIRIASGNKVSSSKVSWILLVLWFPVFGSIIYIIWGEKAVSRKKLRLIKQIIIKNAENLEMPPTTLTGNSRVDNEIKYLKGTSGYSAFTDTDATYLMPGEAVFKAVIEELKKAERFIFIEFFIIKNGFLWDEIFEVLVERRKAGVEVAIIYDDLGSRSLRAHTVREIKHAGIKIHAFNRMVPVLNFFMNYRDHRKIIVIDGKTAFTGGINIGDEYINLKPKFGHWRDSGIMIKGPAVDNFTYTFLSMLEFTSKDTGLDYRPYLHYYSQRKSRITDGADGTAVKGKKKAAALRQEDPTVHPADISFVMDDGASGKGIILPFEDSPVHAQSPANGLYDRIIEQAQRYVYIQTPYLVIDEKLISSLRNAAYSGVDVRICLPGIPDKKMVYEVSRSYYPQLIEAGIKIYEYTPGFIHSKVFLSDDECGVVGSINMDYRSFNLQYESAVYLAHCPALADIKEDFDEIFRVSREINRGNYKKQFWLKRVFLAVIKLFAPMM